MTRHLLVLAGTAEARAVLARADGLPVLASLAGRTARPVPLGVPVRVGGFGGTEGFRAALDDVTAVLDATHPFAARITARAVAICAECDIPYLRLTRPGWSPDPGWHRHADAAACAASLPYGARVMLTTGPGSLAAFEGRGLRLICRRVDPAPDRAGVIWVTGFSSGDVETEARMMAGHFATHLVTKDSGGDRAKLDAAARLGLAVHVIERPPWPGGAETHDVEEALGFLRAHAPGGGGG